MSQTSNLLRIMFLKFPWLNGGSELLFPTENSSESKIDLVDAVKNLLIRFPELKNRILIFFKNAIESKESIDTPTDDETNLALYPLVQIIVSLLGNRMLANALSNIYGKHFQQEFERIDKKKIFNDTLLRNICLNLGVIVDLDPNLFLNGTNYPFKMSFTSYLVASTGIKDEFWKLINRPLKQGCVYLIRHDLVLLIREFIRKKTFPSLNEFDKNSSEELEKIPEISEIIQNIADMIKEKMQNIKFDSLFQDEVISSELFPPCIRFILFRLIHGENLSHYERLSIAFFYLNTNHTIEETTDLFRTSPDFDEKISRYQVEFAAGKGGKGKKYTMFSCEKLKTLQICKANDSQYGDELCQNGAKKRDGTIMQIKNPTRDYIFWKKVQLNRIHRSQVPAVEDQLETDNNKSNA